MRAVFVPFPGASHAFLMTPLAWGMLAAGHDVVFLAAKEAVVVRDAGVPALDPIPDSPLEADGWGLVRGVPEIMKPVTHLSTAQLVELRSKVVGMWDHHVDAFVAAAKRLAPDVIVYDPVFSAGLVAAAVLDVPAVGHGLGPMRHTPEFLRQHAPAPFERHQVDMPKKTMMIDIVPDSLMIEAGTSTCRMRFIPYNGAGLMPSWSAEPSPRPRVAVTLGKVAAATAGTSRLARVVEAGREVDAEFVLTVDDATAAALGPLPPNMRVAGWVPLRDLLRHCSAIIHHGGSGSMLTAAVAGIPQFAVPEGFGYEFNTRAVAGYGSAIAGTAGDISAGTITKLVSDPGLKAAAWRLRREFEQLRPPSEMVDEIAEFAR